ncbi:hypothetical protein L0Z42_18510 [Burkholderia multivorans]|nr:hypothetical protein [Burkholderia multivorans]MCO1372492.1 hypothetical protein [Burkholderia multivorans]MCO1456263.1 hypothetical protein [Burkholderia multivorans]MCO1465244.1 hypothetical protein [Burkholderia multivorans]UQO17012.1 hypothetical protein L0Z02_15875 [Burkholderia multivorans]UQO85609.1 hypothetical protein L0Y86_10530 [Burkholderia multivorans]
MMQFPGREVNPAFTGKSAGMMASWQYCLQPLRQHRARHRRFARIIQSAAPKNTGHFGQFLDTVELTHIFAPAVDRLAAFAPSASESPPSCEARIIEAIAAGQPDDEMVMQLLGTFQNPSVLKLVPSAPHRASQAIDEFAELPFCEFRVIFIRQRDGDSHQAGELCMPLLFLHDAFELFLSTFFSLLG